MAEWEPRVRLFGLVVLAVVPCLVGCGLLFTFVGEYAGVGVVQRLAIGAALVVALSAIAVCRRRPPEGHVRTAVRGAFFASYAAVAVAAALTTRNENWEILSIPIYFMLIFSLHALYERCIRRFETFGK
ncbi:hypothetical protein DFR70_104686 [Nocardia tenerifensis]|uniref:Uncharacterized protein n=1 Tax=Nocardia tenerifensis TaxID=228006 RepID=A0A318K2W1_9NOCA|nr:hypothetical protein [Nocardia tenerifensis]PXX65621.1 hypothetical protein DFR70_104686 [Nocardia tenerifensis]